MWMLTVSPIFVQSQIIDVDYTDAFAARGVYDSSEQDGNIQVLKSGFVDFLTDGNIQASARLLRINIGEMNGFYLPFFIYTGASGNAFGSDELNQTTVSNLLNPIGGNINLSFNGLQNLISVSGITKLKLAYQFGGRLLNGRDSVSKENLNFFNSFGNIGFFFQTGAWTPTDPSNMGVFYIQAKCITSMSSQENLQKLFGRTEIDSKLLLGYSVDAGIEINRVINIKLGLYQYTNKSNINLLKEPIIKFSLDYALRK